MVGGKYKTVKELSVVMEKLTDEIETLKQNIRTRNDELCQKIQQLENKSKHKSLETNDFSQVLFPVKNAKNHLNLIRI